MAAFQAAAGVLLDARSRRPTTFRRLLLARDAFALADAPARDALMQARGAREMSGADAQAEPRRRGSRWSGRRESAHGCACARDMQCAWAWSELQHASTAAAAGGPHGAAILGDRVWPPAYAGPSCDQPGSLAA